jgi:hypothetical protein
MPVTLLAYLFGDDDDEEGNLETKMRNYLTDMVGADAARAMWKGLPTMMGLDVSGNLGMGSLLSPVGFMRAQDVVNAKTGKDAVQEVMFNVAGAPIGMVSRWANAALLAEKGDFGKAWEQALPKFAASPVKATRYATEGITTSRGNQAVDAEQFSPWDVAFHSMGFQSSRTSEYYEAVQAKENVAAAMDTRRQNIVTKAARGEDMADEIAAYNEDHPKNRITYSTIRQSIVQRRQDAKLRSNTGVRFDKDQQSLLGIDRFAEDEELDMVD